MDEIIIQLSTVTLKGNLVIPENPTGLIIFAHGSGSGRLSKRNQHVAQVLQQENLATLLLDLLTEEEDSIDEVTREFRFDIPMLAQRLIEVVHWSKHHADLKQLGIGFFGASTGAAAALIASARLSHDIDAVVSRGGRPDLAIDVLDKVTSPTLLIVGGADTDVIPLNEQALKALACHKKMEIVEGATHLFEEPGTLDEAAKHATHWFIHYIKQ